MRNKLKDAGPAPFAGQIWRDANQRSVRLVLIRAIGVNRKGGDIVEIITCDKKGRPLEDRKPTYARLGRFGRSGGYKYVGPIPGGPK